MNKNMSFFEHLDELRNRIIKSILFSIIFTVVSYLYSDKIIQFLISPINEHLINFQVLKITSIFFVKLGVSVVFGLLISFPFILFQILKFILPVFEKLTIRKVVFFTFLSYLLFLFGMLFGYKVIIPFSISFFTELSSGIEYIGLNYTLENYLSYIMWILVASSLIFQLPFILIILVKIKIFTLQNLINSRKHFIVFFFILGALMTPPDPMSQIFIVIPLIFLFEISIILVRFLD